VVKFSCQNKTSVNRPLPHCDHLPADKQVTANLSRALAKGPQNFKPLLSIQEEVGVQLPHFSAF